MDLPATYTESCKNNVVAVFVGAGKTYSNSRYIPYAERYRASVAVMETPIEHIQKAAQDEEKRKNTR